MDEIRELLNRYERAVEHVDWIRAKAGAGSPEAVDAAKVLAALKARLKLAVAAL